MEHLLQVIFNKNKHIFSLTETYSVGNRQAMLKPKQTRTSQHEN